MHRIKIHGDPAEAAEHMERYERSQLRKEAGTGCDSCDHGVTAWGKLYCMQGDEHPHCVHRGVYQKKQHSHA